MAAARAQLAHRPPLAAVSAPCPADRQIQQLERENHDLAARLERAFEDQSKLGIFLQERTTEALDAARRVTDLETELARLKMDRALQAGRSPFSPNVSFDGVAGAGGANASFTSIRKQATTAAAVAATAAAASGGSSTAATAEPQPLSEQIRLAMLAEVTAAAAAGSAGAEGSDGSHRSELDGVVPSLDTSQLSVSLSEQLAGAARAAGRAAGEAYEAVLDVSLDEEWRIADHAYLSLNDRARKLESLRDSLDQRLRKGANAGAPDDSVACVHRWLRPRHPKPGPAGRRWALHARTHACRAGKEQAPARDA